MFARLRVNHFFHASRDFCILRAAAQQQATDRAHRIGQTRVVSVQKVIAKGTIEERILHLQEEKSKLADQVIGSSGISLASLSADDLMDLLEG